MIANIWIELNPRERSIPLHALSSVRSQLCNDRRAITADTALMLARVFGNSADFWLNVQRRNDLWEALHSPDRRRRIERARPVRPAAA